MLIGDIVTISSNIKISPKNFLYYYKDYIINTGESGYFPVSKYSLMEEAEKNKFSPPLNISQDSLLGLQLNGVEYVKFGKDVEETKFLQKGITNFVLNKHIEFKKQIKQYTLDPNNANKFIVDFIYNYYSKQENIEKNYSEKRLFDINNFFRAKAAKIGVFGNMNLVELFNEDLKNFLMYSNILSTSPMLPYYGKYTFNQPDALKAFNFLDSEEKKKYDNTSSKYILGESLSNRSILPFYVKIYFDNIRPQNYENSFIKIFRENEVFGKIIFNNFMDERLDTEKIIDFPFVGTGRDPFYIVQMKNLMNKHKITIKNFFDLLEGNKTSYSEVIGYRINKYDEKNNIIDAFFFSNSNDLKTEFVDSQVHYGKKYKYKIFYYVLSFSSKFSLQRYKDGTTFYSTSLHASYQNIPNLSLSVIDGPEYSNQINSKPPLVPNIEFVPYLDNDKKVKINLSTLLGTYEEEPKFFSITEQKIIDNIKKYQDREDNKKIIYLSDDLNKFYEIYKLYDRPVSYNDFLNGEKIIVETQYNSISYIDEIMPNKKVYYCFRAIDKHDQFSNFSDIYIYEIIKDEISMYNKLEIKKIDEIRENVNLERESKKMKKHLYISPAAAHLFFDSETDEEFNNSTSKSEVLDRAKIGILSPAVWDKKFKIRITSLSSGKKIDFNIAYNIKKNNK